VFDKELIKEKMKDHVVIADRYFSTTLCYQTLEGFEEKKALQFADDFGIVKPTAVLYLDVSPDTAIKWKYGEDKEKNFRENDHSFIRKTYEKYKELVKRNVWAKWIRVQGEQSKEKVTEEIINIINTL
jgi:thymidylate kinase